MKRRNLCAIGAGLFLLASACTTPVEIKKPDLDVKEVTEKVKDAMPMPAITAIAAADMEWKPGPSGDGVEMAVVHMNKETGATAMFARFPAGWEKPDHYHPTGFSRLLVEGDLAVTYADGTVFKSVPGDYVRGGANGVHSSKTTGGALMFIATDAKFGAVAVDKDGKPVNEGDPAPGEVTEKASEILAANVAFVEIPETGGVQMGPVYANPDTGAIAAFIKFPASWKKDKHLHPTNFHRVMIDGDLTVTDGDGVAHTAAKGDFAHVDANAVHTSESTAGGTIFIVTEGPFSTVPVE